MIGFEIHNVTKSPAGAGGLKAHGLDQPRGAVSSEAVGGEAAHSATGQRAVVQSDAVHMEIRGWAVGRESAVTAVEIVDRGVIVSRSPVDIARTDIARLHADAPGAEHSGFRCLAGLARISRDFTLVVRAVLEDGSRVSMATIEGHRPALQSSYEPRLQPLMLTTLGRSGSTWMMRLLDASPKIVVHQRFPYEARATLYWFEVFRTLVDPDSYLRQLTIPTDLNDTWWAGGPGFRPPPMDPALDRRLADRRVGDLAGFCQRQIDTLYSEIAGGQEAAGKWDVDPPVYFAEKLMMRGHIPDLVWELYGGPKEIVLVRDFRDVVCSILAFIKKRGHTGWGRDRADSDAAWIRQFASQAEAIRGQWESRIDQVHLVRYEDLILEPTETARRLLAYLELPAEEENACRLLEDAAREMPGVEQHRTARDATSSVGRWARDLTPELQRVCQEALGPSLEAFGYESDPAASMATPPVAAVGT